jgi:Acyl-CoA dehydrogenase, C-terminal domain
LLEAVAPELAARWLPELCAGRAALALSLEGSHLVADAQLADLLLIQQGTALHAVPRAATRLHAEGSVDGSRRLFRVEWTPGEGTLIASDARVALAAAHDRGALATSAQLIGIARHLLDVTVEYVKVRKQFGKPIGSFQAVKHHLADAVLALEFAAPVVYRAAYSVARGDASRTVHVAMAKAYASDAAQLAARKALQCHGAMGYAYEYDLHLWMKRAWALARSWGDAAWHRSRVAAALLDGPRLEDSDGRGIHHRRSQNPGGKAERGPQQGPPV